jgi:hypothetical protein
VIALALLAMAGVVTAAIKLTGGPDLKRVAAGLGWPVAYVRSAATWARKRGLPLEWVLATIVVESRGNPSAAGDADGRSVGLMQVNASAHAAELSAAGLTRASLFDPETNIQWGTKYLADFKRNVLTALGGRKPPIPLDMIVRLAYKGPAPVTSTLRSGGNPADLSWAPAAINNWRQAMARVTTLTKGRAQA